MLTYTDLRKLRDFYHSQLFLPPPLEELDEAAEAQRIATQDAGLQVILAEIGKPTADEIIDTALNGLRSDDRNIRVLMLRVLRWQSGARAMQGILMGMDDHKRRVKEVAIKCCLPFLRYPEITKRLEELITDDHEHKKIREGALRTLTGHGVGADLKMLPQTATDALETLAANEKHRAKILFQLLQLDLSPHVEELLREFVQNGTKDEAVMATKALCGYRVIHLGAFENNKPMLRYITQNCELAGGRMFYWMKRDEFQQLLKEAA